MKRKIVVAVDFLDENLKNRIVKAADSLGFETCFFNSAKEVGSEIEDCEILMGSGLEKLIKDAKSMKWFCNSYAGVEKYLDPADWPEQEVLFTNSSGAYGLGISEHIVMVLLMMLRRMPEYYDDMSQRHWKYLEPIRSVHGLKVTMIGTGDIGTHTARSLSAMGAKVTGVRRNASRPADPAFCCIKSIEDLDSVLAETDALVMAVPSTDQTKEILTKERIAMMPEGSYVVNVGRGSAIDEAALKEALDSGHLAGAALDVMVTEPLPTEDPLWSAKNILLTPHCSGDTALYYAREKVVDMFLENLELYAKGEPLKRVVDLKTGY